MKNKGLVLAIAMLLLAACAPRSNEREASQRILKENEQRLATLENSVTALNSQVAQLNNRVYEVRTRNGQKTSMTVVPIANPGTAEAAVPAAVPAQTRVPPRGRKVTPAAKPAKAPAKAAPRKAATASQVKGPSGQLGGQGNNLALPPAELPAMKMQPASHGSSVPVPQGNTTPAAEQDPSLVPPVPIPLLPAADLSLPPEEHIAAAQQPAPEAQAAAKAPAPKAAAPKTARHAAKAPASQSEQAAYNAALSAARSGRAAEGIKKFQDFLQKYPNGRYAANAEYWIGECLYAQGKYKEALSEFQGVNNSFPSHHKNADALLKAGMTMSKMGDKEGANEKFRTLLDKFPNSDAARRARAMGVK